MTPRSRSELEVIPGIGASLAADLEGLGIRRVADLKHANAQALYDRLSEQTGVRQDRCVLYAFRCAVYYASRPVHEPEKLKWWNWKDKD
jgi:predicted flap endonuclease-1-like 5' DNA nuclease